MGPWREIDLVSYKVWNGDGTVLKRVCRTVQSKEEESSGENLGQCHRQRERERRVKV